MKNKFRSEKFDLYAGHYGKCHEDYYTSTVISTNIQIINEFKRLAQTH